ncbi:MAG: peptidylprolyl isomerase [Bacteroidetes bacterium]|nr:peptidylprolyl isomerase [Bacteroidota bacterium]MCH8523623.1 peptidylprolyl isomerase [Balneolales bacterium]
MPKLLMIAVLMLSSASFIQAQQRAEISDKIVAVVNDHIILKSEVDNRTAEFMQSQQGLRFSEELWFDVLESMIDNFVMVEKARIDSIIVSDDEVNRQLDQRIRALTQRAGGEQQLERALGRSIVQLRAEFREQFRQDLLAERVRDQKRRRITITRPEVEAFFNEIPTDSLPTIPETVELAQIVIIPPPKEEAQNRAFQLASAVRDSILNHGAEFEAMARRFGEDGTAANGGLLPLMPMSDLVSEYSAAASALSPGEVSQVVRTPFGYHIIRLNRRVADQIESNHILFRVGDDELDEEFAIKKLAAIRDSVKTQNIRFADLARRHSDDRNTAPSGGRLLNPQTGERLLPVDQLDPNLFRTVLLLENIGDISEPRPFNTGQGGAQQRAFRIVMLNNRVPEHIANLNDDFELIRIFALQEKQQRILSEWMADLRKEVYVEYFIYNPFLSSN